MTAIAVPRSALENERPLVAVASEVVATGQQAVTLWNDTRTYVEEIVRQLRGEGLPEEPRDRRELLREITNVMDKAGRSAALFARAASDIARLDELLHGERQSEHPEKLTEAQLAERVLTMAKTLAIGPDGRCRVCNAQAVVEVKARRGTPEPPPDEDVWS